MLCLLLQKHDVTVNLSIEEVFEMPVENYYNDTNSDKKNVLTVHYQANPNLSKMQVSFHWWAEESTTLHKHDHYEFFIITSGRIQHTLNGDTEILEENTLQLIRPDDVHQFSQLKEGRSTHINISATCERFEKLCAVLGISIEQLLYGNCPLRFELSSNEMDFFIHRSQQLNLKMRDYENDYSLFQLIVCEMLVHAISILYKRHPIRLDNRPKWFCSLLKQLHSPDLMNCNAEDVYKLSGYSPPVVIKHFKQYTGETVQSYLVKLKTDWAILLLHNTDKSILEISEILGYSSLSHFCKLFKNQTGETPARFRISAKNTRSDNS